jgi:hypothetical protein
LKIVEGINLISEATMQAAKVVRVIDHGTIVQLLCSDERGLLSVYFDIKPFDLFQKIVKKAGLSLNGLEIEFNMEMVSVTSMGKILRTCPTRKKTALV